MTRDVSYRLRTLGTVALCPAGEDASPVLRNAKPLAVLAYLALTPGNTASRRHLGDLLWPELEPGRRRGALRQALYYLSQKVDEDLVEGDDESISLRVDRLEADVWRFDRAIEAERYEEAVAVCRGSFLVGLEEKVGREFERWIEAQDQRISAAFRSAAEVAVEAARDRGEPERAVEIARAWVDRNPLEETAQAHLIGSLIEAGDRAGAYRAYEAYRAILDEELEAEPGESLRRRMEELERGIFQVPGPPEQTTERGEATVKWVPPKRRRERRVPFAVWGLAGATLVVLLLVLARGGTGGAEPPRTTWESVRVEVDLDLAGAEHTRIVLGIEDGQVRITTRDSVFPRFVSPDGRRTLRSISRELGAGIAVVDRRTGKFDTLSVGRDDEGPEGWAPDGRRVLLTVGRRVAGDETYERWLETHDLRDGSRVRLVDLHPPLSDWRTEWSPTGAAIALETDVEGYDREVVLVDADGERPRRPVSSPAWDGDPAWSPSGEWFAFASDRAGTADVWIVRPDGSDLQRVTFAPTRETNPVWLSEDHLAFIVGDGAMRETWVLNILSHWTRKLTEGMPVHRIEQVRRPGREGSVRIEEVEVVPASTRFVPGQVLQLRLVAKTPDGDSLPRSAIAERWFSDRPDVVSVDSSGLLEARSEGRATIIGSAGGWRSDTVRVVVREMEVRDVEPIFLEDWEEGLDRWIPHGDPKPLIVPVPGGEPFGSAFQNNGDENYYSGVFSRRAFSLVGGVTAEWWASLPFTGRLFESLHVTFCRKIPGPEVKNNGCTDALPSVTFRGEGRAVGVRFGESSGRYPLPRDAELWHRHVLQVDPSGRSQYFVDDSLVSSLAEATPLTGEAHLGIYGRSIHGKSLVGPVRVYRGPLYVPRAE